MVSSVGVIDKSMSILTALEAKPLTLAELVSVTDINRATAHRLASALETHGMIRRVEGGRYVLGYRLWIFGQAVPGITDLAERVRPALEQLRDLTGESAQLYVQDGDERVCLAVAESTHGLRTIVPVGARLTLQKGSAGEIFRLGVPASGWVESVAEREPGVASVSAAVLDSNGKIQAVLSVSGPIERTTTDPGARYGTYVSEVAAQIASMMS